MNDADFHLCMLRYTRRRRDGKQTSVKLCGDVNIFTAGLEFHLRTPQDQPAHAIVGVRFWPLFLTVVHDL